MNETFEFPYFVDISQKVCGMKCIWYCDAVSVIYCVTFLT